ncbi:serine/threonine-protein kinase RIO2 [Xylona heveae TC161]|uniref:Serine/threonine-protein kinase RIO2 n=1 Tax=Xylona heveae (strain CBS 132557 / TC161) TaxID=1328760 RepID=A0A161TBR5_XYLHT|nr:serine/threonine-protein kinase RIO2 [Xylona heveae TC161]KZF23137.1 serine/threonine-protein kinase RIO2 [Xylona heveae TC161]
MKLDTKAIRYLTAEDWRVLTAVEMGSKNHEVVPTSLIAQISGLRGGSGVHRSISNLAKVDLIAKVKNAKYDGYRLTYGGLDYLALNTYRKRKAVYSVGNQIGVGKESDIYVVSDEKGVQRVLKIHRLGRISFRTVKANRDYLRNRSSGSWMYMSRLAAVKEFTFMQALRDNDFPVPEPLSQNRHTIVMSLIDAFPLRQISSVADPATLYAQLMAMILRLASFGLIHGDFNEFNILIEEKPKDQNADETKGHGSDAVTVNPILIDFPQMVSIDHPNAEMYFDRDVNCIKRFFERRFHFISDESGPTFSDARAELSKGGLKRLDVEVEASGFSKKMAKELEKYMGFVGATGDGQTDESQKQDDEEADEDTEEEDPSDKEIKDGVEDVSKQLNDQHGRAQQSSDTG